MIKEPYKVAYSEQDKKYYVDGPNRGEFKFFSEYWYLHFDTLFECQIAVDAANIAFKYGREDAQFQVRKALNIL